MATFLELCQDLARESGAPAYAPSSVVAQTGRKSQIVGWVQQAWRLIQNSKSNWAFLRAEWEGRMVIGQSTYTPAQIAFTTYAMTTAAPRFGEWIGDYGAHRPTTIYDLTVGRSDEGPINQISWERWKRGYDVGVTDERRPDEYCLAPDGTIRFGATPDKAYVARGEYRKTAQILAADADVPDMPARFHQIIVWKAGMLLNESDEAADGIAGFRLKYVEDLRALQRDQLPSFSTRVDRPLA
jgi:hypothetical protein